MPIPVRRKRFRPYRRGFPRMLLPVCVAAVLSVTFFLIISSELRPLVETVTVSRSANLISSLISSAVDDCLSDEQMEYADFVTVDTDDMGKILSLSGKPAESSRFKRLVIDRIVGSVSGISPDDLSVPIGNLSGSVLLSGFGPDIRVRVYTVGEVTATYVNTFSAAGVNQTHHGVYLEVSVTIHLLIPGEIVPVTVNDRICVAETIILGDVPDTYIHMEQGSESGG